jgi:hypothetical protein
MATISDTEQARTSSQKIPEPKLCDEGGLGFRPCLRRGLRVGCASLSGLGLENWLPVHLHGSPGSAVVDASEVILRLAKLRGLWRVARGRVVHA